MSDSPLPSKEKVWPCHSREQKDWCDRDGPGGFMGHTCVPFPALPSTLTFAQLRAANRARLPLFKNKLGQPAHSKPDGSDWSDAQWLQAVVGEVGEYANLRKKYDRGDIGPATFLREAADELADIQTYLDILAFRLGIDLGAATLSKFNRVSERVGCDVRLAESTHEPLAGPEVFRLLNAALYYVPREREIYREIVAYMQRPAQPPTPERQPIPVTEIVAALERESANTDTDPRWMAAQCLRHITSWESRTFMCRIDTRPATCSTATKESAP